MSISTNFSSTTFCDYYCITYYYGRWLATMALFPRLRSSFNVALPFISSGSRVYCPTSCMWTTFGTFFSQWNVAEVTVCLAYLYYVTCDSDYPVEQGQARWQSTWKTAEMLQMMAHKRSETKLPDLQEFVEIELRAEEPPNWIQMKVATHRIILLYYIIYNYMLNII